MSLTVSLPPVDRADGSALPHRLRPIPALDGLRALAVMAVVLFHYPTRSWIRGGYLGVDVFFVLSGFLVTAGLLDEADGSTRIRVGRFLAKRGWRLLPGLLTLLAVFLLLASSFHNSRWFSSNPFGVFAGHPLPLGRAVKGVGAALLYCYNFLLTTGAATPSSLGHLWTLAIEGQFYLLWVLILWWIAPRRPRGLPAIIGVGIVGSAMVPWLVWRGGMGANIIYFGTAPRLQQLLAGAAVAVMWRRGVFDRLPPAVVRIAGGLGAVALLLMCFTVGNVTFKYLGAETAAWLASALVIVCLLASPAWSLSGRVLASAPLTWLGRRSYGVYLWHWPLAEWTNRMPHSIGLPLGVGTSLLLAETSWQLVERPAQHWSRRRSPRLATRSGAAATATK
ncbi:MAG: acyltransferase [Acidimicrobiaceae bacterium]|nr:acyltransferase [Acidimicrobiaceae bacterium]